MTLQQSFAALHFDLHLGIDSAAALEIFRWSDATDQLNPCSPWHGRNNTSGSWLVWHVSLQGVFEEDAARLYTAEIVSAIAYLHSRGIVHRDLKVGSCSLAKIKRHGRASSKLAMCQTSEWAGMYAWLARQQTLFIHVVQCTDYNQARRKA